MQAGVGRCWSNSSRCRIFSVYFSRMWCLYSCALDIVITMRFSINFSTVICLPTICVLSREKPLVKTMAPGLFLVIYFQIYKTKTPKIPSCNLFTFTLFCILFIFYTYLYQISSLQVSVKGLTTPLSRWVQVCLIFCAGIRWFVRLS